MSIGIKMGEDIFPSPLRTYDLKVTIETMATIEDFIGHATEKDYTKANDVFNTLMADKVATVLDQEKIKVSGVIYNDMDPEEFQKDDDAQLEMDFDEADQDLEAETAENDQGVEDVATDETEATAEVDTMVDEPEEEKEVA